MGTQSKIIQSLVMHVVCMYESERKAPCKYCQGFFFATIDANSRDSPHGSSADDTSNTDLPADRFMGLLVPDLYLLPQLFFACLCPEIMW